MATGLPNECFQVGGDVAEIASPGLIATLAAVDDYDFRLPGQIAHRPL